MLIPGYDPVVLTREEKKAAEQERHASYAKEADYYDIPEKERSTYYRTRDEQRRNYLRAAELPSPAPRGHYLREFGQVGLLPCGSHCYLGPRLERHIAALERAQLPSR